MKTFPQPGVITLLLVVLITCLLLFLFQKMIWFVVPLLFSLMLYYCLRPVVRVLVVRGMSHGMAAKTVWFLLQLIAVAAVLSASLFVITKADEWQADLNRYVIGGQNLLHEATRSLEEVMPPLKRMDLGTQVDQNVRQFTERFAGKNLLPFALQLLKWLPSLLLIPYFIYFMLNDSTRLRKYIIKSVPNAFFEKALLLFARLDASLQNYFQGLLLLTILDTACLALGLGVLGIKNAIWLGLAGAVLAWIPYIGSVIGCILVVLISAADFPEKPGTSFACLVLFLAVRMLDDFIFLPLTVGRKLHVHPMLSMLMFFLGSTVAGATGLVLALPLFGVIAVIGEMVSQVVTDRELRTRYKYARQLSSSHEAA